VFDDRMVTTFSENAKTIGECSHCASRTNNFENCAFANCNDLVLICMKCKSDVNLLYHTEKCRVAAMSLV
jgi:UPF0176 protein